MKCPFVSAALAERNPIKLKYEIDMALQNVIRKNADRIFEAKSHEYVRFVPQTMEFVLGSGMHDDGLEAGSMSYQRAHLTYIPCVTYYFDEYEDRAAVTRAVDSLTKHLRHAFGI